MRILLSHISFVCLLGTVHAWRLSFGRLRHVATAIVAATLAWGPPNSHAAIELPYNEYAKTYNALDGGQAAEVLGINALRARAARFATGNVLEVAIGTGLQAPYYDFSSSGKITAFTGIDQSPAMLDAARLSPALTLTAPPHLRLLTMDAARLDLPDASFDTVVDTFSMCVFPDPPAVLAEMTRVLKPHGTLILLENTISTDPLLRAVQNAMEPLVTPFSKGCRWNVDVPALVAEQRSRGAGLEVVDSADEQMGTFALIVLRKE